MSDIATNIEQSKELARLLDPSTADMWWSNRFVYWSSTPMIGVATEQNQLYTFKWCEMDVPAWSLSALLEVMPANIKIDDDQYFLYLEKDDGNIQGERYTCYYFSYYTCEVDDESALFSTASYDNAIDAAYEMVCWLLTNNLITNN